MKTLISFIFISVNYDKQSLRTVSDVSSIMGPEREQILGEKMRAIVDRFRSRATRVRKRLEEPPSPDEDDILSDDRELDHHIPKKHSLSQKMTA